MLTAGQKAVGLLAVACCSLLLALGIVEIGLRAAGFEYRAIPIVQFGWPDPKTISDGYVSDSDLLWVTKDYRATLAAARRDSPAIVFMGDSCTQFGTYPSKTLALLAGERADLKRGIKVGVGGWTVVQGAWQLTRDVLPLHPRVVTIYYGWNDHWIALGPPDAEIRRARIATWLSDHLRLVQLVAKARAGLARSDATRPNRVDLATYEATLMRMVRQIQGSGGQAVVITAPSNHVPGHEPEYLKARHLRRLQDLVPVHHAYVEATRRAAAESGAVLCDAAAQFDALPGRHAAYFRRDGIHLSDAGNREMARLLVPCIQAAADSHR